MSETRIDLTKAVQALGEYSARFVTWDKVRQGDIVLSQGGLAEVLKAGAPDTTDPEYYTTWKMRSLHNGAEYELPMFSAQLTAVIRPGPPDPEEHAMPSTGVQAIRRHADDAPGSSGRPENPDQGGVTP